MTEALRVATFRVPFFFSLTLTKKQEIPKNALIGIIGSYMLGAYSFLVWKFAWLNN